MISYAITITEGMKVKNQNKTKIGVGSVVKANIGEFEDIIREGRISSTRKEVVVRFHAVVGKKKF